GRGNAGDSFNGGSGNDTLQGGSTASPTSVSFVPATLTSIEGLKFVNTSGTSSASFTASQIGAQLSSTALITGAAGDQSININTNGASQSINLSGWSFANWTSGSDAINLVLNAGGVTTIVGSSQADTLVFNGNGPVVAGSKFDGGGGSDVIQVNMSIDFSSAASDGVNGFLNMEGITFGGTSTATFSSAQFGAGKISNALTITGSSGTDALVVNMTTAGTFDMSGWSFANWSGGTDSVTVNGTQGADTFVFGSTSQIGAGDLYEGQNGNDLIQVGATGNAGVSIDFSGAATSGNKGLSNIDGVIFA